MHFFKISLPTYFTICSISKDFWQKNDKNFIKISIFMKLPKPKLIYYFANCSNSKDFWQSFSWRKNNLLCFVSVKRIKLKFLYFRNFDLQFSPRFTTVIQKQIVMLRLRRVKFCGLVGNNTYLFFQIVSMMIVSTLWR